LHELLVMDKEFPVMVKEISSTYLNIAPVRLARALLVGAGIPAVNHPPRIGVGALTHLQ
jgi:hypothetical protein